VIDSDGALALTSVPASLIVVGAGAVGCEWSLIFSRLGCKVTLIEMLPIVLPRVDEDMGRVLAKALRAEGVTVHVGTTLAGISEQAGNVRVRLQGGPGGVAEAEYVLGAAGRLPLTGDLELQAAGVQAEGEGWIRTDDYQRTNVPSVLAIGDVTGRALLAHVASRQGIVAVERLAGLSPDPVRDDRIPFVTYTDPEIATVGLTEGQARGKGLSVTVGKFPFSANGRALAHGRETGMVKVVAESRFGRVLGVHMVGDHVSELLAEAVLALKLEASLDEMTSLIRAHPTLSEALGEASLAAAGRALHLA
jgi:dihydrolipoamide dehydrogenase